MDELEEEIGSYANWPKWKAIRYNFFEIKEFITQSAITNRGGFIDENGWAELVEEESRLWTKAIPQEWLAAHFVRTLNAWLAYHDEFFEIGFGPSYGNVEDPSKQVADSAFRALHGDINRALNHFIDEPLIGQDARLFSRVVDSYAHWYIDSNTIYGNWPEDVDRLFAERKSVDALRTQSYIAFEEWVEKCLEAQLEYFHSYLSAISQQAIELESATQAASEATTQLPRFSDTQLEAILENSPHALSRLGFSNDQEVQVDGVRRARDDFSYGIAETKREKPFYSFIDPLSDFASSDDDIQRQWDDYVDSCETFEERVAELRSTVDAVMEQLKQSGHDLRFSAHDGYAISNEELMEIHQAFESLDALALDPHDIDGPQLLAVTLFSSENLNTELQLLPMAVPAAVLPERPSNSFSYDMYSYICFLRRLRNPRVPLSLGVDENNVGGIESTHSVVDPPSWPWYQEQVSKVATPQERASLRGQRRNHARPDAAIYEEVQRLQKEMDTFLLTLTEDEMRQFLSAILANTPGGSSFTLATLRHFGFKEEIFEKVSFDLSLNDFKPERLEEPDTRDLDEYRDPFRLRQTILALQNDYGNDYDADLLLDEGVSIGSDGLHRMRRYQDAVEMAMVRWAREAEAEMARGEILPEFPFFGLEPDRKPASWLRLDTIGDEIKTYNEERSGCGDLS